VKHILENEIKTHHVLLCLILQNSAVFSSLSISQKKMTPPKNEENVGSCPAEGLLKMLSGKWKPQIFRLALDAPLRFNTLLRQLPGSSKQAISVALKEMEQDGLLDRAVLRQKPLHVIYTISEKGQQFVPIFKQLESLQG
jgi:DNA-binding HxlR family transcriptional regulator